MSASAEVIIEREPNKLLIPIRASFDKDGKPAAYLQSGKSFKLVPSKWDSATTTISWSWAG